MPAPPGPGPRSRAFWRSRPACPHWKPARQRHLETPASPVDSSRPVVRENSRSSPATVGTVIAMSRARPLPPKINQSSTASLWKVEGMNCVCPEKAPAQSPNDEWGRVTSPALPRSLERRHQLAAGIGAPCPCRASRPARTCTSGRLPTTLPKSGFDAPDGPPTTCPGPTARKRAPRHRSVGTPTSRAWPGRRRRAGYIGRGRERSDQIGRLGTRAC